MRELRESSNESIATPPRCTRISRVAKLAAELDPTTSGSLTDEITDPLNHKTVIVTQLKFSGRIANKRATGTYQSKSNPEGGIHDGYCGNAKPVMWSARRSALPPSPPGSL